MTEKTTDEIAAIILAGGESTRMGKDKALLTFGNETLLSRICLVGQEVATSVYVVSPWIEKYRSILPPGCLGIKEKLVLNAKSNAPIIGFTQGLESVKTEWVLLLACDLAQLSSSQVKQWLRGLTTVLPTTMAFLPRNSKGWEALCGFYRPNCIASLNAYIDDGGRSFQGWLRDLQVEELKVSDRTCLFNCNTPADWQSATDRIKNINESDR